MRNSLEPVTEHRAKVRSADTEGNEPTDGQHQENGEQDRQKHTDDWRDWGRTDSPGTVAALVDAFWPGPLNIIVERKASVPDRVVAGGDTVAIGCLSNPVWRDLAAAVEGPLCMTSANLTGQADGRLVDLELASAQVGDRVDYILEGGPEGTTQSSTIVDLSGEEPTLPREGDITRSDLNDVVEIL